MPSLTRQPADIRVEVTGSNIKRVEGEGALPVRSSRARRSSRSGATNADGTAAADLGEQQRRATCRSATSVGATDVVGADRVAARPRRRAHARADQRPARSAGFSGEIQGVQGVNLSAIPFAAIERVEVLKDGASAIYGSDAIAGVINFIMRQDYRGAEVTRLLRRADARRRRRPVAGQRLGRLGRPRRRTATTCSSRRSYNEQKSLDQSDRNFSKTSYRPDIGLDRHFRQHDSRASSRPAASASSTTAAARRSSRRIRRTRSAGTAPFFNDESSAPAATSIRRRTRRQHDPQQQAVRTSSPAGASRSTATGRRTSQALYSRDETHLVIQPVPISEPASLRSGEQHRRPTIRCSRRARSTRTTRR